MPLADAPPFDREVQEGGADMPPKKEGGLGEGRRQEGAGAGWPPTTRRGEGRR